MNIVKIVLHNHTYASDGRQSPLRLLRRAKKEGVDIISITDHNSVEGYKLLERQIEIVLERAKN